MKKALCALVALCLCLCLPAAAEVSLVPTGTFGNYAYFEDDCARVIDADAGYREGLFDIYGNNIIPCAYTALSGYGVTGYYVAQKEDGVNVRGALNASGGEAIPFRYGDIRFLSGRWAVGVVLEATSITPCDYEGYIDGKNYNAIAYDIYDLAIGACVGSFDYQACTDICAHGAYLYVRGRDGVTTVYDERLRKVRDDVEGPYVAYGTVDGDVVSLSTGETVLEGHRFGAELGGGLLSVSDGGMEFGICDASGALLTGCEFDRIFAADANGDVRVEKDGKAGLVDCQGNPVVPCGYDSIARFAFGGSYVYRLRGCACVEREGAYNFITPDGQAVYPEFFTDVQLLGLSMVHTDSAGQKHILAADGTRTPTAYTAFAAFPGGDGTLLKAQGTDGQWYLIDWHGRLLLPYAFPYAVSVLIAPDGSAVLAETEGGKTAYAVWR